MIRAAILVLAASPAIAELTDSERLELACSAWSIDRRVIELSVPFGQQLNDIITAKSGKYIGGVPSDRILDRLSKWREYLDTAEALAGPPFAAFCPTK